MRGKRNNLKHDSMTTSLRRLFDVRALISERYVFLEHLLICSQSHFLSDVKQTFGRCL